MKLEDIKGSRKRFLQVNPLMTTDPGRRLGRMRKLQRRKAGRRELVHLKTVAILLRRGLQDQNRNPEGRNLPQVQIPHQIQRMIGENLPSCRGRRFHEEIQVLAVKMTEDTKSQGREGGGAL